MNKKKAVELVNRPLSETVSVVVAEPVPRRMSPPVTERSPPCTVSLSHGAVVPMPTFPVLEMKIVDVACAVPASSPTMKFPLARESEEASTPERESVPAAPPTREPSVPEYESPVPSESVVVATLAKVFTPEKYGRLPITAAVEVERPPKERVAPVSICGQVAVRASCFALKVSQSMPVRHPFTPL